MTFDRHTLAERLRPHLSPTEPRLASELLVLAGVQTGSRVGGVVAAALQELRAAGHARPAGGTRQALRWLASAPGDLGAETLPLARLDATVTLTTTARTTAGGTKRTELAAVVTLGPSWPATTPTPPRWSTAFSDAQVAAGALTGARTNAITRAEAQLRALRKDKTLPLLPTEDRMTNPLLLPSKDRDDFLAYLASVARGARQDSAATWLSKRGLARTPVEATAWLEEAVEAGVLAEHRGTASDGTVVLRYSPADPSVKAAPLPKSSAPEELPAAKPLPPPKVTPKKAPKAAPAAPVADEDTGDPTDDEDALDDPAEHDSEDPPEVEESGEVARLTRERDDARQQALELDRGWDAHRAELAGGLEAPPDSSWADLLTRARSVREENKNLRNKRSELAVGLGLSADTATWKIVEVVQAMSNEAALYYEALCRIVPDLRGTSAKHLAEGACQQVTDLRQEVKFAHAFASELSEALALPSGLGRRELLARVVAMAQEKLISDIMPQTYQGDPAEQFATSIAGWLVGLSDDTWLEVTRARHQLAESRRLREQSHSLELHALDALDRAVGARPAAQASAPVAELVPDPIPLGPPIPATPEPPASAEQANDDLGAPARPDAALAPLR